MKGELDRPHHQKSPHAEVLLLVPPSLQGGPPAPQGGSHRRAGSTGTTGDESCSTDEEDVDIDEPDITIREHVTRKLFDGADGFGCYSDIA